MSTPRQAKAILLDILKQRGVPVASLRHSGICVSSCGTNLSVALSVADAQSEPVAVYVAYLRLVAELLRARGLTVNVAPNGMAAWLVVNQARHEVVR